MEIASLVIRRFTFGSRLDALRPRLYRLAFSWCKDAFQADDLVQEAMARALQKRSQLRDEEMLDRWVTRILANLWMDLIRRSGREDSLEIIQEELRVDDDLEPECLHCRDEMIERVRKAVMRLPEGQRMVVTLVDLEEFSYRDVSAILDVPIGTVMSRLSRGRQALKTLLLEERRNLIDTQPVADRRLRRVV